MQYKDFKKPNLTTRYALRPNRVFSVERNRYKSKQLHTLISWFIMMCSSKSTDLPSFVAWKRSRSWKSIRLWSFQNWNNFNPFLFQSNLATRYALRSIQVFSVKRKKLHRLNFLIYNDVLPLFVVWKRSCLWKSNRMWFFQSCNDFNSFRSKYLLTVDFEVKYNPW